MRAFLFKEDRLLRLRKQQVIQAEFAVAKSAAAVDSAKRARQQIILRIEQLDRRIGTLISPSPIHINQVGIRIRSQLEEAREVLAVRQQTHKEAIQFLQQAIRNVESLVALEQRQKTAHQREQQKQEQASIDSIATMRWLKKGTGGV